MKQYQNILKESAFCVNARGVMFNFSEGVEEGPWKNHGMNKAVFKGCIVLSSWNS